ncbi:hypothetical protein FACS1894151_08510 [Spirochaetia bacterium]|nr:hypothetical protein FACS1894151_08510 [Spirochaetia bacterium]
MSFFNEVSVYALEHAEEGRGFVQFPVGENEAYIAKVEEKESKSGNSMLEITFANESDAEIRWYIMDGEYKLSKLKNLMVSFNIPFNLLNPLKWIGRKGIIIVKEDKPYNGRIYNKVSYCKGRENMPQSRQPANHNAPEMYQEQEPEKKFEDEFGDDIPW